MYSYTIETSNECPIMFGSIDDVPEPIGDCYTSDEEGNLYKYPAHYANGGHISPEEVAKWDFHDSYIDWLCECHRLEFEHHIVKYDEDGNIIDKGELVLPPAPVKEEGE
jgi:hypothetical protein